MKKIITISILLSFLATFYPNNIKPAKAADGLLPVYSLWDKTYSYRYFTISESEKNSLIAKSKWKSEGISWYAYSTQQEDAVPVYRLYNSAYRYYYYTTSESAKNSLSKKTKWTNKGIVFYAYATEKEDTTPVYALMNSKTKKYFYTSSPGEKNCMLTDSNWTYMGTAFWVPEEKANVSDDETSCNVSNGPEISVGLWNYSKNDLKENPFKIEANKDYVIKDRDGKKIADVSAKEITRVKYNGDKNLLIYKSIEEKEVYKEVRFEAKDGNNSNIIFDIHRPGSSYDQYRGKINLKYTDSDNIWVINILPMELYAWGMGETSGTGPFEHTKVMTTIFRTYGYWYKKYATKYLKYGFIIRSDSGSQIYRGYDWEKKYPNIKKAAIATKGIIVKYKNEIALTPYSSWTDGKTRSFEERWGSNDYPWCKSVKDPYGKHPSLSTKKLVAAGNHMVGMSANGSLKLAGSKYKKSYSWILKYYYTKISLTKMY
jgi:hypothetical protein